MSEINNTMKTFTISTKHSNALFTLFDILEDFVEVDRKITNNRGF